MPRKSVKPLVQIGLKINGKVAEALTQMAKEARTTPTIVAKDLLIAAIRQAQEGEMKPLPPHLRRFYGQVDGEDE